MKDEGIRQEYERTVTDMKSQAQDALNNVKEQSERILAEAKKLAQEIEDRARKTAAQKRRNSSETLKLFSTETLSFGQR